MSRSTVPPRSCREPAPAPKAEPKPDPISVTSPDVTESAEEDAEKRYADFLNAEEDAAKMSARCLAEFTFACRTYLPKITVRADRHKARMLFKQLMADDEPPKAEAA